MPIRLGIDASQTVVSCAISTDKEIITSETMEKPIEIFPKLIRDVIVKANITLKDIDEIVVCIGPGSQMGTRAAVVTGNALALALNKPISGVLSTDAAAILSKKEGEYKVAISAGRRRWYVDSYSWKDSKLNRLDELNLVDDLPDNTAPMFYNNEVESINNKNCAYGILLIAESQRQLITQSMLDEIRPHE